MIIILHLDQHLYDDNATRNGVPDRSNTCTQSKISKILLRFEIIKISVKSLQHFGPVGDDGDGQF